MTKIKTPLSMDIADLIRKGYKLSDAIHVVVGGMHSGYSVSDILEDLAKIGLAPKN